MSKGRLEAFSDGVIAIIITIMVLELTVPHEITIDALRPLIPIFLSYVLSFINVGIYWNNHHHLLNAAEQIDGRVLWANMHLLFWLSLIPFGTAWMGENNFALWPVVVYGIIFVCAGIAYFILTRTLLAIHDSHSTLAIAIGRDVKGMVSVILYLSALALAFISPWISCGIYVLVAAIWLIPDRRIERTVVHGGNSREVDRVH